MASITQAVEPPGGAPACADRSGIVPASPPGAAPAASAARRSRSASVDAGGASIGDAVVLAAVRRKWVEDAEVYYDLLHPLGPRLDIWETEYLQVLTGDDPVLEWVKGTGLRPILNGLGEADRRVFLEAYRRALRDAYPQRAGGRTLYPFRRLFIVAQA